MFQDFFDQYASRYAYAKPGRIWCYEDACVYRGLMELYGVTGRQSWRDHLRRLISIQIDADGVPLGYAKSEFNIDNILGGRVLFALVEHPGDRFDTAIDLLADQLAEHPRTASGNYWHKTVYPQQVWLDGLYMGLPFQIEYGRLRGRNALVDDAADQLLRAMDMLRAPKTGLYYHGIDTSRTAFWADPETGLSQSFWGRANGWLAMAMIDIYALLPEGHFARSDIRAHILSLADAIVSRRTENGLWLQVMDRPDLAGNYEEMSSSAMFSYFLIRAARLVEGAAPLNKAGLAALDAISKHYVRRTDDTWQLENICEVAGLGGPLGKQRNGTPAYYVSEPIVANDPKGVGPLMMAVAERERTDASGHEIKIEGKRHARG